MEDDLKKNKKTKNFNFFFKNWNDDLKKMEYDLKKKLEDDL